MNNKIIEPAVYITYEMMNKYPGIDWLTVGLYIQIKSLATNEEGYCSATNEEFATLFGVSDIEIKRMLTFLVDNNLINCELSDNNQRKLYTVE